MNTRRSVLLAMLIAFTGLIAFQPAGAVIESGYIEDFSDNSAETCTGQENTFLAPAGPGILGSLVEYVSVPGCQTPANLLQPVDVQDSRLCDAGVAHAKPCYALD